MDVAEVLLLRGAAREIGRPGVGAGGRAAPLRSVAYLGRCNTPWPCFVTGVATTDCVKVDQSADPRHAVSARMRGTPG